MIKPSVILGISAYYHDSAAAQEERFTRKKYAPIFPKNAIDYVLASSGFSLEDVDAVAFYDKPYIKFERLLETYHVYAPHGLISFLSAIPVWIKEKLFLKKLLRNEFVHMGGVVPNIVFPEHHLSHAASAFYPSPFQEAAILTLDGVGEWATTTIGYGKNNAIDMLKEIHFPHSLGLFYSAFTYYCGFRVNSGEYKLMGLAPYGDPDADQTKIFKQKILNEIIDVREDGSFLLNASYFNYATGLTMTKDKKWQALFGIPRRRSESDLTSDYMNLALAIQQITEDVVIQLARTAKVLTKANCLVLAGGVALNCVANGKLLRCGLFKDSWIQPAAGDAGGAVGAAYSVWHISLGNQRSVSGAKDRMSGSYLGPDITDDDAQKIVRKYKAIAHHLTVESLFKDVSIHLKNGLVVGWFQGRMEFATMAAKILQSSYSD